MQAERAGLPFGEHTPLPSTLQLPQKAKGSFRCSGKSLSYLEADGSA
jgi:hypothetical protein